MENNPSSFPRIEVPRAQLAMVLGIVALVLVLPAPFIGTTVIGIAGVICAGSALMIISEAKAVLEQDPQYYLVEESERKLRIGRTCARIAIILHFLIFALFWVFIIFFHRPFFAF